MYRNLMELRRNPMFSLDGRVGSLEQVLFDDVTWAVRYLIVDLDVGLDQPGRKVQLRPAVVDSVDEATLEERNRTGQEGDAHFRSCLHQFAEQGGGVRFAQPDEHGIRLENL